MIGWDYYDSFDRQMSEYLPDRGQGETMATQIVTAVNKLVYKWYNDGDVYDNTGMLFGWVNDISDYANWLAKYTDVKNILDGVFTATADEYEVILKKVADRLLDLEYLEQMNKIPAKGDIYDCAGDYHFVEEEEDEW